MNMHERQDISGEIAAGARVGCIIMCASALFMCGLLGAVLWIFMN